MKVAGSAATDDVDADVLRHSLDGRWSTLCDRLREQLPARERLHTDDLEVAEHRALVRSALASLVDLGVAGLGFDSAYGGGDDFGGSVAAMEIVSYGDLSLMVKAGVQWGLFGGAIAALGTEQHHRRYLPDVISGALPGCFAMTETGHGSNVRGLCTTAAYDPRTQEFVLNTPNLAARKDYIGNAAEDAQMAVVFAQLITGDVGRGPHAFLVPIRDHRGASLPDVVISDCGLKAGLNGVDNGRLVFHRVRVPRRALLDRYGQVAADGTYSSPIESESRRFFTMLGTLVRGRISVAACAGAAAKKALTIAVRYAEARRQFSAADTDEETLLLDYPLHQRRLLPRVAQAYALSYACGELLQTLDALHHPRADTDPDELAQRRLESHAAALKAVATEHAVAAIEECRRACGGAGYISVNQIPQLRADTDVFTTFEGDNAVLLQLAGKGLLTRYREHVGELDPIGLVRFSADQVVEQLVERTAARSLLSTVRSVAGVGALGSVEHRSWMNHLFADRAQHLLETVARRLRRAAGTRGDAAAAVNAVAAHLLHAARADAHNRTLQAFRAAITRVDDPAAAALLGSVCDLYALAEIEADAAWFCEHDRFTAAQSKKVTADVDRLCAALRPHARLLVDAFGVPDRWLTAPIARA